MSEVLSALLISLAEVIALVTFLLLNNPKAYQEKPSRFFHTIWFLLLNYAIQHGLHKLTTTYANYSSLLTALLLLFTIFTYALFIHAWTMGEFRQTMFLGMLFTLIDNCAWSIFGKVSFALWGNQEISSGDYIYLNLFTIFLVEMLITVFVKEVLPPIGQIHINTSILLLTVSVSCSYYYVRVFAHDYGIGNTYMEIVSALICLVSMILIVYAASSRSKETEKLYRMKTQNLLASQQAQFQRQLTDIENVNRKYHDLKNMLLAVQADSTEMVSDLVRGLRPFEANIHTGNQTIDIILTDKLARCQEAEITCTPSIDGNHLSFVDPLDLCVLFGNAMDNAIEACLGVPTKEKRNISIQTKERANTLLLSFRNTCDHALHIKNGLPQTTKGDVKNHGYGLKSMQMVMEKYQGKLSCQMEGEEFVLSLLFFLDEFH